LGPYIVDFACLEKKLIVEVDGGQHTEKVDYETERIAWLESQGFRVLRFWNNEVLKEIEVVKEVIAEALGLN
jgi:very-short-patch-repair endonuclease